MDINKVAENLEKNNMKVFIVEDAREVVPIIKSIVPEGSSVSNGGSVTLKETGVMDLLNSGYYDYIDRTGLQGDELRECYVKAYGADAYFCSSNAITENGELYNVDGNSNRVSCIVYGPKKVVMVCGINKIVKDIDEAINRVKTIAAPKNTKRLNCETPCVKTGECFSLSKDSPELCDGCKSPSRICCNYVVTAQQRHKDRINIILVKDNFGY